MPHHEHMRHHGFGPGGHGGMGEQQGMGGPAGGWHHGPGSNEGCGCGCHGGHGEGMGRGEAGQGGGHGERGGCRCGCHQGPGSESGFGFTRRFVSRAERIEALLDYLDALESEAEAVEELLEDMGVDLDALYEACCEDDDDEDEDEEAVAPAAEGESI